MITVIAGAAADRGSDAAVTVVLVVSELVTDAWRHGGGRWTLELTAHPDTIEVGVHDPSRYVPRMLSLDPNGGTGGFDWPVVTGLAHATPVTSRPSGGKTVSASTCPVASPLKQPDGRPTRSASYRA
ncbi:ATP-binding protein [Streptomyces sp. NPDC006265]|uniref:ATP-binding protein n=1 Tax=Streptomyces sp. NPDC006265 TaxID=3156740 RepID=UPI0033B75CD9